MDFEKHFYTDTGYSLTGIYVVLADRLCRE